MSVVHNHNLVHRLASALQEHLAKHERSGGLDHNGRHFSPEELAALHKAIDEGKRHEPRQGAHPYFARDPLVSLVQSSMHEYAVTKFGAEAVAKGEVKEADAFTPSDFIGWGVDIGLSLIGRLLDGSHPFQDAPAQLDVDDSRTRLVLFSDWGTGEADGAGLVIEQARSYVQDAESDVHVIHLGDTYYSGTPFEAQKHILDLWPCAAEQSEQIGSWALNGNHDMYSGGHGYFETTLGDPRFHRQRADQKATSWFHLRGARTWDVIGLDSAYRDPIADFRDGTLFLFGRLGFLQGSQAAYVNQLSAAEGRRLLLLSHHQLFSAYDDDITKDSVLRQKLAPTLARNDVDAWFWGHEHDCMAYQPFRGVKAARVIGHGAVPTPVRTDPPGTPYQGGEHGLVVPTPSQSTPPDHPLHHVKWEYRDIAPSGGENWGRHGFAVVDIAGDTLHVRHIDQDGTIYMDETL